MRSKKKQKGYSFVGHPVIIEAIYEMKMYLYNIYFDFCSVTRFMKIWLETTAYFILTASQVDLIVVKHS